MIQLPASQSSAATALGHDFLRDKQPLITAAGFDPTSEFAGQARQTFSLMLSENTVAAIRQQVQGIYDQLITDCWPANEPLPFDMIRLDAFLDPTTDELKIIEINTRNVGLHEVVEWLDNEVSNELGVAKPGSLNQRFVQNQKLLHSRLFGADEPLLFISPEFIPQWLYFDELTKAYSSVKHISTPEEAETTETGISVDGQVYKAIVRKMAWPVTPELKALDASNLIRLLQPLWIRPYGLKNYLQRLSGPAILRTESYTDEHLERYLKDKDQLVLKITDGGGSKSVYLGALSNADDWREKLQIASERPNKWIIQDYFQPPSWQVIAHGQGERTIPTQLGIFVLPSPDNPRQFDFDITVKGYAGSDQHFTFDPSGIKPNIWFGHVIKLTT